MVFKKHVVFSNLQSLQHEQDGIASSDNPLTSGPKNQVPKSATPPETRKYKKVKKMYTLRRAIRAIFCFQKSGGEAEPVDDTESLTKPPGSGRSEVVNDGATDTDDVSDQQQPEAHSQKAPLDQSPPALASQKEVAPDEKSPSGGDDDHEKPTGCPKPAPLDEDDPLPAQSPGPQVVFEHLHGTGAEPQPFRSIYQSPSCSSFDEMSKMTSRELQDYLNGLAQPAKEEKADPKDVETSDVSSGSLPSSSSSSSTQDPPEDPAHTPTSPDDEVVYHPHLGCRVFDRSEVQLAVGCRGEGAGLVGEGSYARVTAVRLSDGTLAAAKVLQTPDSEGPVWQEIIAVAAVGEHPAFPRLYGVVEQRPLRTMLYEFVGDQDTLEVTTLYDALSWKGTPAALTRKTWMRIVRTVCQGLLHMHDNDYIHCDIKSDNVLLYRAGGEESEWMAKIIDMGNACPEVAGAWLRVPAQLRDEIYQDCPMVPPEVLEGDSPYNKPAEVYTLGDLLRNVGRAAGIRRLRKLGKKCQNVDFRKRPTMAQVWKKVMK